MTQHAHHPASYKRILVPIDFSEYSKKALASSVALAKTFHAELILIYVVETAVYPADFGFGQVTIPAVEREMTERGEAELKKLVATQVAGAVPAQVIVVGGKPFLEIIKAAEEERADLIVIATHGHTGVEHILFGSTAEKVVRKAPCDVMVVR